MKLSQICISGSEVGSFPCRNSEEVYFNVCEIQIRQYTNFIEKYLDRRYVDSIRYVTSSQESLTCF